MQPDNDREPPPAWRLPKDAETLVSITSDRFDYFQWTAGFRYYRLGDRGLSFGKSTAANPGQCGQEKGPSVKVRVGIQFL